MQNKEWHFFVNGFMNWMWDNFPKPMKYHFTYDLLENTINKLITLTDSQGELGDWLEEIIPEVTREEIDYWFNR